MRRPRRALAGASFAGVAGGGAPALIRPLLTDPDRHRYPQVILRVGYDRPAVATPRRPLAEVLVPGEHS